MAAVNITLETLFDLLRTEKNREELQALEPTFYRDIVNYLNEKRAVMHSQNGGSDFFTQEDRDKSLMQFNNIRKMIRELYEKRERKIIQMALNKSKMNAAVIDTSSLLDEERIFYEELVYLFNKFRQDIVLNLMEGNYPRIRTVLDKTVEPLVTKEIRTFIPQDTSEIAPDTNGHLIPSIGKEDTPPEISVVQASEAITQSEETSTIIKMIRFLQPVPRFVGEELEVYGPFDEDDVANVPARIADLLIKKGRAEPISEG